jgi:CTD small phosphatase-like protein 2
MIIVDNAVYSFGYQLDNGIPIIPYYSQSSNPEDEELMHLVYYFNCICQSEDIRVQNRKAFQLKDLQELDIAQQLRMMQDQK